MKIKTGEVFSVEYPFILADYETFDEEGPYTVKSYRPGVRYENTDNFGGVEAQIDGKGKMQLTVIDIHKPGKYPTRVFFTRQWIGPDGKQFGRSKLHITTAQNFKRIVQGYRYWDEIGGEE